MVRIVSGQRSDPNEALLQGMELGKGFRQAQMARQEAQAQQMSQALRMQEIQMRFQKARADREQMLNQAAQMGDARALQEMQLRQQMKPSQSMAMDGLKMLEGITDPDARALALPAVQKLIAQQNETERQEAGMQGIQDALKDGLIDEVGAQSAQQRIASGEEPEKILQEFATVRFKNAKAAASAQENAQFVEQARMIAESAPTAEAKRKALIPLTVYEQSPAAQEKPGSGAAMLEEVMRAANAGRDEQIADTVKRQLAVRALALAKAQSGGDVVSPDEEPQRPVSPSYIEKRRAEKERRYPGSTAKRQGKAAEPAKPAGDALEQILSSSSSDEDLVAKLKASGIPKTPENQRRIQEFRRAAPRK